MKNMCSNCDDRNKCVELCKEAEKYADQDYVGGSPDVMDVENINVLDEDDIWSYTKYNYTQEELERLIIQLHKDGLDSFEIAYHVPYHPGSIRNIIKRYKKRVGA